MTFYQALLDAFGSSPKGTGGVGASHSSNHTQRTVQVTDNSLVHWICYVMLSHVLLCYDMSCHVIIGDVMLCYVISSYVMLYHVMLCHITDIL